MIERTAIEKCKNCRHVPTSVDFTGSGHFQVTCPCGCAGPVVNTATKAIKSWNKIMKVEG